MVDRRSGRASVGEDSLTPADALPIQWERVGDGTLTRRGLCRSRLPRVRAEAPASPGRGARCGRATAAGVCRGLLAPDPALYAFAAVVGVEPTTNAAGRAGRPAVCRREMSDGTDSAGGSRFAERALAAVATCRRQGRDVLGHSARSRRARRRGLRPPALVYA